MTRCGDVAVLGAPNAGKSTLINTLVGAKVAIVSAKVQTTRTRLMGIALAGEAQLLLIDTPGIFAPRRRLDRAMVKAAWSAADDADAILVLVDARQGLTADVEAILSGLDGAKAPVLLALNKIDTLAKPRLLALAQQLDSRRSFAGIFMISALSGDGVETLRQALAERMPEGPWHFPEDQVSNITERMMACELTREKLYLQLHDELPYAAMVEHEQWEQRKDGSIAIHQVIHVERDTHKAIVLGKGGARIKAIGSAARADMEAAFGVRVHLFVHVKVTPGWADNRGYFRDQGLDWVD